MDNAQSDQADAPRVLVVDDEQVVRRVVADALARDGCAVRQAADAAAAQALLTEAPADVVLTDLAMPGLGGLGLMQWACDRGGTNFNIALAATCAGVVLPLQSGFKTTRTATPETAEWLVGRGATDFDAALGGACLGGRIDMAEWAVAR